MGSSQPASTETGSDGKHPPQITKKKKERKKILMFGVFLKTWLSKVWGNSAIPISNQKFFLCKPQPDPGGAEPKGQKGGTELPGTRGHGQVTMGAQLACFTSLPCTAGSFSGVLLKTTGNTTGACFRCSVGRQYCQPDLIALHKIPRTRGSQPAALPLGRTAPSHSLALHAVLRHSSGGWGAAPALILWHSL